jgi:hypothetical protein
MDGKFLDIENGARSGHAATFRSFLEGQSGKRADLWFSESRALSIRKRLSEYMIGMQQPSLKQIKTAAIDGWVSGRYGQQQDSR